MKRKISHQISFMTVIMVLITASVITCAFYKETSSILVNQALNQISDSINKEGLKLQEHILNQREDTLLLGKFPDIQKLDSTRKTHVEEIFTALIQTKSDYSQIRYIDSDGKEVVRIEKNDSDIIVVADNQLQDKSSTDYFIKTKALKTGDRKSVV